MILRNSLKIVEEKLQNFSVVGLLGVRQVGKTTLAQMIAAKRPSEEVLAIEIKRFLLPKIKPGFYNACKDIKPTQKYVVYDGQEKFSCGNGVYGIGLKGLMEIITDL